ncbi:hypothetical protein ACILDU_00710 [Capnocytophaga canimorsus]
MRNLNRYASAEKQERTCCLIGTHLLSNGYVCIKLLMRQATTIGWLAFNRTNIKDRVIL